MATTRYSRDAEPAAESKGRGPLGVITLLLALYSAVVASILLFRPAQSGGGTEVADAGGLNARFDAQARKLRTETTDDVDKRLKEHTEKLALAAKRVEDAGKSVQAVADSAVRRADETARGAGVRVENLDEKIEDLSKTVTGMRATMDVLATTVQALEARPIAAPAAAAPPPTAGAPPVAPPSGNTATPPEPPPGALTPEQIAAQKEKVKNAIAELASGEVTRIFPAAVFLGKAGDLSAVEPLVKVIKETKDPLGRSMAAQALGRLRACDAVPVLLSLFTEKNADVFLSAVQGFSKISELDTGLSGDATRGEKKAGQDKWTSWWKDHEAEMRKKWGQEKVVEPAPAMGEPGK
jgi:HEAT repeat protein